MEIPKGDFYIQINFDKQTENPSRIFQAMSNIINAFQEFDNDLIAGIDSKIEPVILLEDVEVSSLKVWLANVLRGVPDEAVKDGDWKKAVGVYLIKAKYIIINKLEGKTTITDATVISEIQHELLEEAKKTDIKLFPSYSKIPTQLLLKNIDNLNKSVSALSKTGDSVVINTPSGEANFNLDLIFTPTHIEELLTKETIESKSIMILKIKKPDYLGTSMWDFKYDGHLITAKVLDVDWLARFQSRSIDIRPGDSIRACVMTIVNYGYDYNVIGHHYEITEVKEVIPLNINLENSQDSIF